MKKPSVTIGTPHNRDLAPEYVMSLINLLGASVGKIDIKMKFYQSCLVNVGRNVIGDKLPTDYLLFIDSDITFPAWSLERLISHNKDIVGGMYFKKLPPHLPLVYSQKGWSHSPIANPPSTLFQCDGIGTGFLLIKKTVLKDLYEKKFAAKNGFPFNFIQKPDGNDIGEDLAFCMRARKKGYKIWCDPSIPLEHIGDSRFGASNYEKSMKESVKKWDYTNEIEGWMSKEELNFLYKIAGGVKDIVEIGSWKGRSTHALLSGCKGTVTAIDTFKGSPGEKSHIGIKPYKDFIKNVGNFKNLKVIKSDSIKASKKFKGKVDFIFIDGAHTYEAVKADIEAWLPKARIMIAGHDFQWPGVQKAVTEKLGYVHKKDTIWYKKLN